MIEIFKQLYMGFTFIVSKLVSIIKIKNQVIYLMSFPQNDQGLIDELSKRNRVVIVYKHTCKNEALVHKKKGIQTVPLNTSFLKCIYLVTVSKIIICDNYYPFLGNIVKHGQLFLQIWHATGAIKKFGLEDRQLISRSHSNIKRYKKVYHSFDKYVVSSYNMGKVFERSYGAVEQQMLYFGLPRTDIIYRLKTKKLEKAKKMILYTPTYRENQKTLPLDEIKKMEIALSSDYIMVVKLHPQVEYLLKDTKDNDFIRWAKPQEKTNELMLDADVLISDYSSVIFDFSLLKPNGNIILFWYDFESYGSQIGLQDYFIETTDLTIVNNIDQLIKIIKNKQCLINSTNFNQEWNTFNDGNSTKRLVEYVSKKMGE